MECFKELFKEHIIPAIEHGFLCERYKATDIEWFKNIFMESINALPDKVSDYSDDNIKQTLVLLVSALIYGPSNGLVRIGYWDDPTRNAMADDAEALHAELEPRPGAAITIRLTQVLDKDCRYTGFSEVFASSVAVFVGRCAEPKDYLERCRDVFKDHPEVLTALDEREKIVFPISPTSTYVSWIHALLLYLEGSFCYYVYELGSTNGTSIKGLEEERRAARVVKDVSAALPGDKLTFGAPGGADDAAAYNNAVTLLLTRDLGRSMQLG